MMYNLCARAVFTGFIYRKLRSQLHVNKLRAMVVYSGAAS